MYHYSEISSNYHWNVCFSYCFLHCYCVALDGRWLPKTRKQFKVIQKADYDQQFKENEFLNNSVNTATSVASWE